MRELDPNIARYQRQIIFPGLGVDGHRQLAGASALVVGVGGLGSWTAELLARAGVGRLRLVDDDIVEVINLHRQGLYDENDAEQVKPKALAAMSRLRKINAALKVEPVVERLTIANVGRLAEGMDLVLDGTDNFATRFIVNDYCVKHGQPWIFAGVVAAEGQIMTIVPGRTPCLRCVYDSPAPPCVEPTCRLAGVMGPAVAAIASMQTLEALKILCGRVEQISPYLTKFDLWQNTLQRIDVAKAAVDVDCPCCKQGHYEYLEP